MFFLLPASIFLRRTPVLAGAGNRYLLCPVSSQVGCGAHLAALLAIEVVAAHPVLGHQGAPVEAVLAEGV